MLQEEASRILAAAHARQILQRWYAAWAEHAAALREQRRLREEKRVQALAGCRVGLLQRPPIAPRSPLSPAQPGPNQVLFRHQRVGWNDTAEPRPMQIM